MSDDTEDFADEAGGSGTLSVRSPYSVPETVERVRGVLAAKGLELFAQVDHGGGARAVGLEMPDTQLLVFGNPRAGTPAMLASPLLALDLPLRALVWVDGGGEVWVTYQDPADLQRRYQVPKELMEPLSHVGQLLAAALRP